MRDLTGIPDATLTSEGGQLAYFFFVKIVYPAPTGTKRWCDHPAQGLDAYTGNIDGSSQAWEVTRPMRVRGLSYGRDTALTDASVELANLDDYFSNLHNTHGTLRGMAASVYRAHFAVTLSATEPPVIGALYKSVRVFHGVTDRCSLDDVCGIALLPGRPPWASLFPKRRITTVGFPFLSRPDIVFNWGDVQVDVGARSGGSVATGWGATPQVPFSGGKTLATPLNPRTPIVVGPR